MKVADHRRLLAKVWPQPQVRFRFLRVVIHVFLAALNRNAGTIFEAVLEGLLNKFMILT